MPDGESQSTDWQPIETATAGKVVLLYFPRLGNLGDAIAMGPAKLTKRYASHWMTAPEPPSHE